MDKLLQLNEETEQNFSLNNSRSNLFNPAQIQFESDKVKKKGVKQSSVQIECQDGFYYT